MNSRWHQNVSLCGVLLAFLTAGVAAAAQESGPRYIPDPSIEQAIDDALNTDKAIAYPAIKKLSEISAASRRALENRLFNEKTQRTRVQLAEILARACEGRVVYRITLELSPDGSGKLRLDQDRSMLAECALKYDKILGNPPTVYPDDELRRNPYGRGYLAKHMEGGMKYLQGDSGTRDDGRIFASGELSFSNFDEFAGFASSFDRSGYHMLNGITLTDSNNQRTLHFKKNPDQNTSAARYLLLFHDVKWEFVLDFKGTITNSNATSMSRNKHIWTFNCAQMLTGEAEIEASFDSRQAGVTGAASLVASPVQPAVGTPVAVVTQKAISVLTGKRDENGKALTRGPDYEVVLDGRQSTPKDPDLRYQWVQTSGIPLNLQKERIAIPVIRMLIYQPGEYKFELTVAKDGMVSAPSEVLILVGDDVKPDLPGKVVPNTNIANGGSTQRSVELDFGSGKSTATNSQPRRNPEVQPDPGNKNYVSVPVDTTGGKLELSLIRQAEDEFIRNLAAGGSAHNIVVPNSLAAPQQAPLPPQPEIKQISPPVPQKTASNELSNNVRLPAPSKGDLPPAPPVPSIPRGGLSTQGSEVVAINKASLEEIRRTEAQFNSAKPDANLEPVIQKVPPVQNDVKSVEPTLVPVPVPVPVPNKKEIENAVPSAPPVDPKTVKVPVVVPVPDIKKDDSKKIDLKAFENELKNTGKEAVKNVDPVTPVQPVVAQPVKETVAVQPTPAPEKVIAPANTTDPRIPAGSTLEQGVAFMKTGQYASAVETLKRAQAAAPSDETKLQLAIAMLNDAEKVDGYDRPKTLDAMMMFEDLSTKNSKNPALLMNWGHANARLDNMQQASKLYQAGKKIGGDAVSWESMWQLGNKFLKAKDYAMALTMLKDAEETAAKGKVKDARLERDFAIAYHGTNKDDEAVKHAQNVLAMGFPIDPKLAAELKIANTTPAAVPATTVAAEKAPEVSKPAVAEVKTPTPAKAVEVPDVKIPVKTVAAVDEKSEMVKRFEELLKEREQTQNGGAGKVAQGDPKATQPLPPVPAVVDPKSAVPPVHADPVPATTVKDPPKDTKLPPPPVPANPVIPENKKVAEAPKSTTPQTIEQLEKRANELIKTNPPPAPAAPKIPKPGTPEAKVPRAMKKLPPVPDSYESAFAAGRQALERGLKLSAQNPQARTEEAKGQIQDCWDEAEAMLRGAWNLRTPAKEKEVIGQLTELSKQIGAIALVSSQNLVAKKNGLVVLNAEPSVIYSPGPTPKQLFYAWDQVDGPDLDLRRENLALKKLGLRIKEPGIYKFELVVSDGVHGGNPVTVTVDVQDNRAHQEYLPSNSCPTKT